MNDYIGIGDAKVSVSDQVFNVLNKMDRSNGLISDSDLKTISEDKSVNVKLINTQHINGEEIKIYGLSRDNSENFEIVKVKG
ncbi:hypothetical protein [Clostridium magnum]|uniref:Uncharacterized protein n=1 Tax=Clostridium magnum DSM 2767 TaxID=1121326 RepID=A0A161WG75_9CLOT|nr:hypothetical protein [Clostridium magnum]KZL90695.1 hypothetical protein CLMAG_35960 [Clostridium magnum DSM 2767]SHI40583.1 hypothetical protein SAMN02745944_04262 [Clostridium magnum DSM 2767]